MHKTGQLTTWATTKIADSRATLRMETGLPVVHIMVRLRSAFCARSCGFMRPTCSPPPATGVAHGR